MRHYKAGTVKFISVMGQWWRVVWEPLGHDGLHGQLIIDTKIIKINSYDNAEQQAATLLHELFHAILFTSGQGFDLESGTEEALVRALEHGLAPVVKIIGLEDE